MAAPLRSRTAVVCTIAFAACAGPLPDGLGVSDSRLAPCPASPNCVASDADDSDHAIAPLVFDGDADNAWSAARTAAAALPRTRIVEEAPGYLRAESRSALFRFVDDLELQLHADDGTIAVRSASRVGYSDLGVNRSRVEALRSLWQHELE